jgi:hypothetical protein
MRRNGHMPRETLPSHGRCHPKPGPHDAASDGQYAIPFFRDRARLMGHTLPQYHDRLNRVFCERVSVGKYAGTHLKGVFICFGASGRHSIIVKHKLRSEKDRRYAITAKGKARSARYDHSAKGKARKQRWRESLKGRRAIHRYNVSPKGQAKRERSLGKLRAARLLVFIARLREPRRCRGPAALAALDSPASARVSDRHPPQVDRLCRSCDLEPSSAPRGES